MAVVWKNPSPLEISSSTLPDYYGQVGMDVNIVNTSDTTCVINIDIWFWSKYGVNDSNYTLTLNGTEITNKNSIATESLEETDTNWGSIYQVKLTSQPITFEVEKVSEATFATYEANLSGINWIDSKCGSSQTLNCSTTISIPMVSQYYLRLKPMVGVTSIEGEGLYLEEASGHYVGKYSKDAEVSVEVKIADGYGWNGWSDGVLLNPRDFVITGDYEITAQTKPDTYYVYYDANGGAGAPERQPYLYNSGETISTTIPTKTGHKFLYWCLEFDPQRIFNPGDLIPTDLGSFTLVAQWKALGLVYIDNGTQFEAYQMFIDNGNNWDQVIPYMDNGSSWESLL